MAAITQTVEAIVRPREGRPSQLIEVLQDLQECQGYVSEEAMSVVSERLGVPLIEVYRVANFYPFHNKDCVLCGRCVRVCAEMWRANALGFVGRGKERRVDFPLGKRPDFCKRCNSCIDLCPMTIPPCPGPMKPGQEHLCGQCESQLSMVETMPESCVQCELGRGFNCVRAPE